MHKLWTGVQEPTDLASTSASKRVLVTPAPLPVLATCLQGRRAVQDGVLEAGVLPLILESTKSDHSAPMAREWALMAIRNLCEGNLDAQVLD